MSFHLEEICRLPAFHPTTFLLSHSRYIHHLMMIAQVLLCEKVVIEYFGRRMQFEVVSLSKIVSDNDRISRTRSRKVSKCNVISTRAFEKNVTTYLWANSAHKPM